ncbi:MAG: mechanosensitive ion channel family protein [Bacilli bacterium]|nr:mechanosensitive ion channel family protein [Bacilli bacterium]
MDKIFVKEIVAPILIVIIFSLLYIIIKKIIKRIAKLKLTKVDAKRKKTIISLINNVVKYFFVIIATLMILNVYEIDTSGILTSLGVVSVVAGLAFQDTLKDLLSGFFIIFENQYSVGDTVTIDNFKGEVISLGLKITKIKAFTGEIKIISNRNIESVINHSLSQSLAVVNFLVSYDEDLNKVEKVLIKLCERLTNELAYLKGDVTLVGVTDLSDYGVKYRITVETESLKHYETERAILKELKLELDKNNIVIPYNQMVIRNA